MEKNCVCGCDVESTYGKAAIMDLEGNILGSAIVRSKVDPAKTSMLPVEEALEKVLRFDIVQLATDPQLGAAESARRKVRSSAA